jgi:hypothetical protein
MYFPRNWEFGISTGGGCLNTPNPLPHLGGPLLCSNANLPTKNEYHAYIILKEGKAIPLQAWTGPQVSRRLRLPDFKTIGT